MRRESCALREVILAASDAVMHRAEQQKVEMSMEVPGEFEELALDRSPMERVFENLLGNAH